MTFKKQSLANNSRLIFCGVTTALLCVSLLAQQSARRDDLDRLLANLKKAHFDAAQALISEKDPRSIAPVIADLKDDNPKVRRLAAMVLGEMKARRVADPLINVGVNQDLVTRAVDPLIQTLADQDWTVRIFAAKALGQIGDRRAIPPLLANLNDPDIHVEGDCAIALGTLRASEAVDPLLALLERQSNWAVRENVVEALGDIGDSRATESLVNILKGQGAFLAPGTRSDAYAFYEGARKSAVYALAKVKDPRAVEPLIAVLNDTAHDGISRSATYALGELGDARAIVPLVGILKDPKEPREAVAAIALGTIGGPAIQVLIKALKDKEPNVRQNAVFGLSANKSPEAIKAIAKAFKDPNRDVRAEALKAIRRMNPPDARKIMAVALKNSNQDVRDGANQWLADYPLHKN